MHELVKYEGLDPKKPGHAEKATVVDSGDLDEMYARRDALNATSLSLTVVRYGVRSR